MADFFTDSDDDKAVEELLSQAMDSTVLEQVAAINCAGLSNSGLPSHLETRFQKLKSFPSSKVNHASLSTKSFSLSHPLEFKTVSEEKKGEKSENESPCTCSTKCPKEKSCLSDSRSLSHSSEFKKSEPVIEKKVREKSENESSSTCSPKCHKEKRCLPDSGSLSPFKISSPLGKMEKKGTKLWKSPSCDGFSSRSNSPPVKSGCFLCSPKKKKSKENRGVVWGRNDELLSDLSNNQRKMIKRAMEEEERICKEAEKIVKWAKHASARMDISGIEDELSDDENAKFA